MLNVIRQIKSIAARVLFCAGCGCAAMLFATDGLLLGAAGAGQAVPWVVPWQEHFVEIGGEHWHWRAAQVKAESNFRLNAVSPVGARGPAQFMPKTWAWAISLGWIEAGASPHDLIPALTAQNAYMVWLFPRAGYDKGAATGAYNCGLGNVQKAKAHAKNLGLLGQDAWLRALPSVTKSHAKETQDYVSRVRRFEGEIKRQVGL